MKKEFISMTLKVVLTDDEKKDLASILSENIIKKTHIKNEEDSVKASFKDRYASVELEVGRCARLINDGYDMRSVECEVIKDFNASIIRTIRTDTGETVKTKPMTGEERQMHLDEAIRQPIQDLQDILAPGESMTIGSAGRSVTLEIKESDEEIRRQQEISRTMTAETSAL
jgi:hypothetical protein